MNVTRMVGQIWDFAKQINKGDLVALPLKMQSAIALGRIEGDYEFKEIASGIKHIRSVKWLQILPRTRFDQDLLFSLGAFTTVCRISRNDAENRIKKLLDNTPRKEIATITPKTDDSDLDESSDISSILNTEQNAKDMIIRYIEKNFIGHDMARLVEALLKSQGYITTKSEPGKDGGIDILAGLGPLGFNEPRICAQIKSSASPIHVRILRVTRSNAKSRSNARSAGVVDRFHEGCHERSSKCLLFYSIMGSGCIVR
jgi:restriction system protein